MDVCKKATVLLALLVIGCVSGSDLNTHYLTVDQKALAYKIVLVSGTTHQLRIWRDSIVVLPDAMYDAALLTRGAEKAMASVCGAAATPRILSLDQRRPGKATTEVMFRCVPKRKKRTTERAA